jgi:N-methylhydantoinase A
MIVSNILRERGFLVFPSHEILPEFREFERTSTTVINAYVSPILKKYLEKVNSAFPQVSIQVMQSNGGFISVKEATRQGVRCIYSGPAGGVTGAMEIGKSILGSDYRIKEKVEHHNIITFDMGGTSTDVSLIVDQPLLTTEASIDGFPIRIPILDIHTIGAGGGSIAAIDIGGALRVGPMSAGADPGPACYGKSNIPTVSDANLVVGRLLPEWFLGGKVKIDPQRSRLALSSLAELIGWDVFQTALGIIDVVNAHMDGRYA